MLIRGLRPLGILLLVLATSAGCVSTGDRAARAELDSTLDALSRRLDQRWRPGDDPAELARGAMGSNRVPSDSTSSPTFAVHVEPLGWSAPDAASGEVELRITVEALPYAAQGFGGTSYDAGRALRCVRLHVGSMTSSTRIDCDGRAAVPVPAAPPVTRLNTDALLVALRAPSFPAAEAAVRQAYEPLGFGVDAATVDGVWAVAVTRPEPYDCVGAVRDPAGGVRQVVPDRATRQPGEGGCSPANLVHPIRTH